MKDVEANANTDNPALKEMAHASFMSTVAKANAAVGGLGHMLSKKVVADGTEWSDRGMNRLMRQKIAEKNSWQEAAR